MQITAAKVLTEKIRPRIEPILGPALEHAGSTRNPGRLADQMHHAEIRPVPNLIALGLGGQAVVGLFEIHKVVFVHKADAPHYFGPDKQAGATDPIHRHRHWAGLRRHLEALQQP